MTRNAMIARLAVPALATMALAGCGGSTDADADGDGTVTGAEARAAVEAAGSDLKPEPGLYKSTMTFIDADVPGAPAEMKDMLGSMMSRSFEFCLTPEEAEGGFEDAMTQGQEGCTISTFEIDGSDVNMAMSCDQDGAGKMDVTMDGNVTSTKSDMNMAMTGDMEGVGEMAIKMSFVQERIGECPE